MRMGRMIGVAGFAVALAVVAYGVWVYSIDNVEQASYQVVVSDSDFEIRDYAPSVMAEVTTKGDRKSAVSSGFRPLAEYIFAKERTGDKIAMTAPVTQSRETIAMTAPVTQSKSSEKTGDKTWTVRFVMPAKHGLDTLPKPATADVRLTGVPATRRAAVRFSGVATDDVIAQQEARLREWIGKRDLKAAGPTTYAYYNAPFTPGPFRRNEVWMELAK